MGRTDPYTVKPVLNGHLKIDKTQVLMETGSLRKVFLTCIKRLSVSKHILGAVFEWPL